MPPLRILRPLLYPAALVVFAFAAFAASKDAVNTQAEVVASDYTVMPKGPTWIRPAPTTWSSRANVRWQARWGGDARYIA